MGVYLGVVCVPDVVLFGASACRPATQDNLGHSEQVLRSGGSHEGK